MKYKPDEQPSVMKVSFYATASSLTGAPPNRVEVICIQPEETHKSSNGSFSRTTTFNNLVEVLSCNL